MSLNILDVLREGAQQSRLRRNSSKMGRALQSLVWRDAFINQAEFSIAFADRELRVRQLPNGEINGLGTGLTVWPAACVLLKYLEHHYAASHGLQDKRVVELGCGTGAVGLAAAMLGASVVLTDQEQILFHIHENVQANQMHADVCAYNWGEPLAGVLAVPVDVVLVSDCVLPKLYPIEPLVDAIALLCSHADVVVLISFEHRYYEHFDPKTTFWAMIKGRHLHIREVPIEGHHPNYNAEDIEIWEITYQG
ncbi:Aste57867_280 [Aphanomyces stellatus]|uniref:Aste57867_280 protein n=1 Tax=Aphanomyces stellatus TaxID=120398 RepID=A0A485K4Q7_9STRA|nr:hypothetical protein As57867_000280 [Aphanomyces stellatus]VFT77506.1 Aste57867_280 [Aphanomyces stellatus]